MERWLLALFLYKRKVGVGAMKSKRVYSDKLNDAVFKNKRQIREADAIDKMKKAGVYELFIKDLKRLAFAQMNDTQILKELKQLYGEYIGSYTINTFRRVIGVHKELRDAYTFSRTNCLIGLVELGMKRAEASISVPKDDFIVKFMKALDTGEVNKKNEVDISEYAHPHSAQTEATLNRIFKESERFSSDGDE